MESHFAEHRNKLYIDLIKGIDFEQHLRPLVYAQLIHSQFALLILLSQEDPVFLTILKEHLGIEQLDSALFMLRKPSWLRDNPNFWNAGGELGQFLERLSALALAPPSIPPYVEIPPHQLTAGEHLHFYLSDNAVRELARLYGDDPLDLFQALESASISGILSDLKIQVRSREGHPFTLHLSEASNNS